MKRTRLLVVIPLGAALACFAFLFAPTRPAVPIAILPLGKPYPGVTASAFQVTNRSSREYVVTFKTMVKTNGTWTSQPRGCVISFYHLRPHSTHKELIMVPDHGDSWKLVAEYHRPATRLSRAVDAVRAFLWLPHGSQRTFQVVGPETKNDDA